MDGQGLFLPNLFFLSSSSLFTTIFYTMQNVSVILGRLDKTAMI